MDGRLQLAHRLRQVADAFRWTAEGTDRPPALRIHRDQHLHPPSLPGATDIPPRRPCLVQRRKDPWWGTRHFGESTYTVEA
ncbi:hypothetical protein Misp02_07880 [Microtetraspora sp. NBRC 16547]|nr:hypothetical protein Misp02_07880 [Microtetraspora sp. NBRC 16547]